MAEGHNPQMVIYVGDKRLRDRIEAAAESAGVSVSEWMRDAATEKLGQSVEIPSASAD